MSRIILTKALEILLEKTKSPFKLQSEDEYSSLDDREHYLKTDFYQIYQIASLRGQVVKDVNSTVKSAVTFLGYEPRLCVQSAVTQRPFDFP